LFLSVRLESEKMKKAGGRMTERQAISKFHGAPKEAEPSLP
jgi:hypothetical protein